MASLACEEYVVRDVNSLSRGHTATGGVSSLAGMGPDSGKGRQLSPAATLRVSVREGISRGGQVRCSPRQLLVAGWVHI